MKYLILISLFASLPVSAGEVNPRGFYNSVYVMAIGGYLRNYPARCPNPDSPAFRRFAQMFASLEAYEGRDVPTDIEVLTDMAEQTTIRSKKTGRTCTLYMPNGCVSATCN